jgi:hypothetical protein
MIARNREFVVCVEKTDWRGTFQTTIADAFMYYFLISGSNRGFVGRVEKSG